MVSPVPATDTTCQRRLEREAENLRLNPSDEFSAHPKDDDLFEWTGTIMGPPDSPYTRGRFNLAIHFPSEYPLAPPNLTFTTKIYHPNIETTSGFIGLSILNQDWSPVLTVSQILISLRSLLASPDANDAVMPEIAHEYLTQRAVFEDTATKWTEQFAVDR